ncbi:MAG: glycosyltransferase [Deltaproteobacteria bacterium]|nr:glycosyltransferase [Deltaproteobacteria bacterium]
MSVAVWLVVAWSVLGAVSSALFLYGSVMLVPRCPQLAALDPPEPLSWPALSVVVPARNEARTIEAALASLLAQDHPHLQIVLVDDRSTDGTAAIADGLAASDSRISVIHVGQLPTAWLGKVHALQRGIERACGHWVLFTDADIHFAPGVLRRAVAWAEAERLDHVAVLAELAPPSVWVSACLTAALRGLLALRRPWEASDHRSSKAIGTGAFNLVRRTAFDRTPGFEWLRLEVADDIGLGLMMKRCGACTRLLLGRGQVRNAGYATLADAVRGLEKNAFAQGARFAPGRGMALAGLGVVGAFAPFAAFLPVDLPWLAAAGAAALAVFVAAAFVFTRACRESPWGVLRSLPVGDLVMSYVIARATVLGVLRGGLVWRDTMYPTEMRRAGQRVGI